MGPLDGALGHTVPGFAGFCFEPWGNLCYRNEQMTFDSSLPAGTTWNTTIQPAGEGQYDFESAVIHELGHSTWCKSALHGPSGRDVQAAHPRDDEARPVGQRRALLQALLRDDALDSEA